MRLRLVHTLSLLLLSAVLLAVAAMGAVTAWNLRHGFADYLAARDAERLEQFATLVGQAAEQAGGFQALAQRSTLHDLLAEFAQRQGMVPVPPALPPPARGAQGNAGLGPLGPGAAGLPPGGTQGFGARVWVVDPNGKNALTAPQRPDVPADAPFIERPIRVQGRPVALARMRAAAPVPDAVEAGFLRSQYMGLVGVATALLLLAWACAWWVARRWVRPLQALQSATARIAQGELGVRLQGAQQGQGRGDEIGDLVRNVNHMAQSLQRLEGARRRWLADISHELRTPLAVLRGEIEALMEGVRPLQREAVVSLHDEAMRLGKLVDDLHLLATSDLQSLPCEFVQLDALALAQRTLQRFQARAVSLGLELVLRPAAVTPLWVCWDPQRVEQLLSNLLENSLRYTDAPGRVELALHRQGESVLMQIDDTAPSMSEAQRALLFEPLHRADPARSRHHGGSGLGLSIGEAIARSHGGRLSADASPLGGVQMRVNLPLQAGHSK